MNNRFHRGMTKKTGVERHSFIHQPIGLSLKTVSGSELVRLATLQLPPVTALDLRRSRSQPRPGARSIRRPASYELAKVGQFGIKCREPGLLQSKSSPRFQACEF
jgi:hypothetical protein